MACFATNIEKPHDETADDRVFGHYGKELHVLRRSDAIHADREGYKVQRVHIVQFPTNL